MSAAKDEWPREGLETNEACPVCNSRKSEIIYRDLKDFQFSAPGSWTMHHCGSCGSAYLDPRPNEATIVKAYAQYYTHEPALPHEDVRSLKDKLIQPLENGYQNWRFGKKHSLASDFGALAIAALPRRRARINFAHRYLPRQTAKHSSLLDVGFGGGEFLKFADAIGWKSHGCDFDPVTIANARNAGFAVRQGGIASWSDSESTFDFISLNHVIEHVHHPASELSIALRLLKPGGRIFIETPNLTSLSHQLHGRFWRGLEPPRHLAIFTESSLTQLLERAGFVDIRSVPRPNPFGWMSEQSESIRRSHDEYQKRSGDSDQVSSPPLTDFIDKRSSEGREFLAVVAHRPTN